MCRGPVRPATSLLVSVAVVHRATPPFSLTSQRVGYEKLARTSSTGRLKTPRNVPLTLRVGESASDT